MKGQKEFDGYIMHCKANNLAENTIDLYRRVLTSMLTYTDKETMDLTIEDINRWKRHLMESPLIYKNNKKYRSKNGIRAYTIIIKTFLKYIGLKELSRDLTLPKESKKPPVFLTEKEAYRLLQKTKRNPRDYAIFATFLHTGIRKSELINLNISDVVFKENLIMVRDGKGNKDRAIPINNIVIDAISNYLTHRLKNGINPNDNSDALFISQKNNRISKDTIYLMVKEYCVKAGINKKISPHKLRHTALTHLYQKTHDLRVIQKIAGHSDINTTMIYEHSDVSYLKEVLNNSGMDFTKNPDIISPDELSQRNKHKWDDINIR